MVGVAAALGQGCLAGCSVAFALEVSGVAAGLAQLVLGVLEFFGEAFDGGSEVGFKVLVGVEFCFGMNS
ncbi:hypothetical protein EV650_7061 [Kribbella kalugense]|uniref:Uncharacterized protein n=1 Tax=Kribbella kalugense TaxID=2512221 RepID=A0A4V3G6P6_9ACTN|nr:hypothetical protein EV650_7061 [Kribbella kalugense]